MAEDAGPLRRLRQENLSWLVWLAIGYAGVVVPIFCHGLTWSEAPEPPNWQSGELSDKIGFILGGSSGFVFYPLILYPIICLSLLLFREERFANRFAVRFGVFTGVPVAAWYCAILGIIWFDVSVLISTRWFAVATLWAVTVVAPFVVWAGWRGFFWMRAYLRVPWAAIGVLGAAGLLFLVIYAEAVGVVAAPFAIIFFGSIVLSPFWCFDAFLAMTLRLLWRFPRPARFTIMQLMAVVSWFAAFLAACRWAVILSLEEYSKLPLESPGQCYVATAASRGHAWFVGRRAVRSENGELWQINRQLSVLKAGELAIRALAPEWHRSLRAVYDRFGPMVARRLTHPVLADFAYAALKPCEWGAHLFLICLLGKERRHIYQFYVTWNRPVSDCTHVVESRDSR